ncbi:hypothetical protein SANTM175S_02501 [Streptomyces antimycoticus]
MSCARGKDATPCQKLPLSPGGTTPAARRTAGPTPPTSAIRTTTAAGPSGLLTSLAPLLAEPLPRQRWFAGKGRPVTGFALVSATELLPWRSGGGNARAAPSA